MKIVIERANLLKALGHVQSVVERRGTIPILSNVKIEAAGDTLHLTATDMDIAVVEKVAATVAEPGHTTVPAQTFYDIVRKLPDGAQVEITRADDASKLIIRANSSRFSLATLPVEDFPVMTEGDMPHSFRITAAECTALIDKTRFAVSTEETRYYLNGIYLHAAETQGIGVLRSVATDGHRLARIEIALPAGASGMPGVIIPRKAIGEIKKLLEDGVPHVDIALSESKIRFTCGNAVLVSKLIDGTFPDYERVIPTGNDKIMEVEGRAFTKAVDRVSTIASEKTRGIRLAINQGKLTLSADSPEHGTANEEVDVTYAADPVEIGFNSRYLLEMMGQIEGDIAQFVLADSTSPALVRDTADVSALYVVMPMRV
ncbi:MAG TPA: DNA polymerase III subunit beta [Rickettsiales bacterium]|nr:DNA polymerase III subunit beta [Rickettsiales bacterium]